MPLSPGGLTSRTTSSPAPIVTTSPFPGIAPPDQVDGSDQSPPLTAEAPCSCASALTVAFLIPMFGILWGYVFLDEVLGWHLLSGAVLVVLGTALVTGYSVRSLFKRKAVAHG